MIIFFLFFFGAIIGSFLNVVVYRLKHKQSFLKGRSHCPHCKKTLGFWDLVPIFSFIFLRARCRYCRQKISWQYPLVELAAALAFVLPFLEFGYSIHFWLAAIVICFLIIIFVYDLRYYLILDEVVVPAIVLVLIFDIFVKGNQFTDFIWGGLIGAGFFLVQYLISRGKWIGGGDIRLGLLMGLLLGITKVVAALFIAYIIGAIISLILISLKKKKMKSQIPFGTFLSLATVVVLLYGDSLIELYKNLIGL
ncbi:MAG: prepilin peptidase [Patescibacteria group bacterium]